jgi:hypothetical protein
MRHIHVRVFVPLGLALILLFAGDAMANNVEEPQYQVERQLGDLEVRLYAPLIRATTVVQGDADGAMNEGFRRLAGYIFGGNRQQTRIAMTSPVALQPVRIAMTAPVSMKASGSSQVVSFVMPASWRLQDLPTPNDARVQLQAEPAQRFAVLRFSGFAGKDKTAALQAHVLEELRSGGETPIGEPALARYDPPWTLPFLRRNEIQVPLAPRSPQ